MIPGGYILQPRVIDESLVAKMPPVTRELWFYLLRKVNHSPYKNLRRGQGYFRLSEIQNDLSWYVGFRTQKYSIPQLSKSMRRLREGKMIETMKATHGILITVCNYDRYQDPKNYDSNSEGNPKEKKRSQYIQEDQKNKNAKNTLKHRQDDFFKSLKPQVERYGKETINQFFNYWSEPNRKGNKMRMELEKTWDTERRLARWNKQSYTNNQQRPGQILKSNNTNNQQKIIENAGF